MHLDSKKIVRKCCCSSHASSQELTHLPALQPPSILCAFAAVRVSSLVLALWLCARIELEIWVALLQVLPCGRAALGCYPHR